MLHGKDREMAFLLVEGESSVYGTLHEISFEWPFLRHPYWRLVRVIGLCSYLLALFPPNPALWSHYRWFSDEEPACQHRRCGFHPWVGRIPWRRKWQPISVFLPGKPCGQRSLVGYSPWGRKESDTVKDKSPHIHTQTHTHTHLPLDFPTSRSQLDQQGLKGSRCCLDHSRVRRLRGALCDAASSLVTACSLCVWLLDQFPLPCQDDRHILLVVSITSLWVPDT